MYRLACLALVARMLCDSKEGTLTSFWWSMVILQINRIWRMTRSVPRSVYTSRGARNKCWMSWNRFRIVTGLNFRRTWGPCTHHLSRTVTPPAYSDASHILFCLTPTSSHALPLVTRTTPVAVTSGITYPDLGAVCALPIQFPNYIYPNLTL